MSELAPLKSVLTISEIRIYPIKSCAGFQVEETDIGPQGPAWDREWMIVNAEGKFLTQRTHPQMALIATSVQSNGLRLQVAGDHFQIPEQSTGSVIPVEVWGHQTPAREENVPGLREALSDFLEEPVRLVRFSKESSRRTKKGDSPVRFADGYPLLVTHEASLADLNRRLSEAIAMDRFRPNWVVRGGEAWEEDHWQRARVGEFLIEFTKPCGRCPIVNVDPQRGETRSKEVLLALNQFRRVGTSVNFGVLAVHRGVGRVRVGNPLVIEA